MNEEAKNVVFFHFCCNISSLFPIEKEVSFSDKLKECGESVKVLKYCHSLYPKQNWIKRRVGQAKHFGSKYLYTVLPFR